MFPKATLFYTSNNEKKQQQNIRKIFCCTKTGKTHNQVTNRFVVITLDVLTMKNSTALLDVFSYE